MRLLFLPACAIALLTYDNVLLPYIDFLILLDCVFEEVALEDCPTNAGNMAECTHNVPTGTLCEADQVLPDGLTLMFDINNCGAFDVFECKRGNYTID